MRNSLGLEGGETAFAYLNNTERKIAGMDDTTEFGLVLESMGVVGIDADTQRVVCQILAAVLHLGNVSMTASADADNASISDPATLATAARLLGLEVRMICPPCALSYSYDTIVL